MYNNYKSFFIQVVIVILTVNILYCNKEDQNPIKTTNEVINHTQVIAPGQITAVTATQNFTKDTLKAYIDDTISITIYTDSNSIYFALPVDLPAGNHTININTHDLTINVATNEITMIEDPELYLDTLVENRILEVQNFLEDGLSKEDCDSLMEYCNWLKISVTNMDSKQKEQLVEFLIANKNLYNDVNQSLAKLAKVRGILTDENISEDNYVRYIEEYNYLLLCIRKNIKIALAGSIIGGITGSMLPGLGTAAGAIIGALPGGLKLAKNLKQAVILEYDIAFYKAILVNITENGNLYKRTSTVFESGVPVIITLNGVYRTLQPSDSDGELMVLSAFLKSLTELKEIWNDAKAKLPFYKIFNGRQPVMGSDLQYDMEQRVVPGKLLKIDRISNPNVTGELIQNEQSVTVRFNNKACNEQDFSYYVLYENAGLGSMEVRFEGKMLPCLQEIQILPSNTTLLVNDNLKIKPKLLGCDNTDLECPIIWGTTNPDVATVDQNGNISAKKIGGTVISASLGDITSYLNLTVIAYPKITKWRGPWYNPNWTEGWPGYIMELVVEEFGDSSVNGYIDMGSGYGPRPFVSLTFDGLSLTGDLKTNPMYCTDSGTYNKDTITYRLIWNSTISGDTMNGGVKCETIILCGSPWKGEADWTCVLTKEN